MFRSFADQLKAFLDRPHDGVPAQRVDSPAAWCMQDLGGSEWRFVLSQSLIQALSDAVELAMSNELPIADVRIENVPVPGLSIAVLQWRDVIEHGPGFALVSGLPVEQWSERKTSYAFWVIGHYLGVPGAQNPDGELLGHVRDYGEFTHNKNVRRYRTAGNIDFHCDPADVVGLLCLRTAKNGGASRIASSTAIVNELLKRSPEFAAPLFTPTALDRRDEQGSGESPVIEIRPCCYSKRRLRTFYHSEYFRSAARHSDPPRLNVELENALDAFDKLASSSTFRFDMQLEPGDMQFLSNHSIVHARTAYEDWPEPERRRHLLRLWLSLPSSDLA